MLDQCRDLGIISFHQKQAAVLVFVRYSSIAQLVEQRTVNPFVPGSSPGRGATNKSINF